MKNLLSLSVLLTGITFIGCGTIGVSQTIKNELLLKNYPIAIIKVVNDKNSVGGVSVYVSW